jgi:hypothetical protein
MQGAERAVSISLTAAADFEIIILGQASGAVNGYHVKLINSRMAGER